MKEYTKPLIEDEEINIEDICTTSFTEPQDSFKNDNDIVEI